MVGFDGYVLFNNNGAVRVEFTQSARRHKICKARVRQVMANPLVVDRIIEEHAMDLRPKFRGLYEEGKLS